MEKNIARLRFRSRVLSRTGNKQTSQNNIDCNGLLGLSVTYVSWKNHFAVSFLQKNSVLFMLYWFFRWNFAQKLESLNLIDCVSSGSEVHILIPSSKITKIFIYYNKSLIVIKPLIVSSNFSNKFIFSLFFGSVFDRKLSNNPGGGGMFNSSSANKNSYFLDVPKSLDRQSTMSNLTSTTKFQLFRRFWFFLTFGKQWNY